MGTQIFNGSHSPFIGANNSYEEKDLNTERDKCVDVIDDLFEALQELRDHGQGVTEVKIHRLKDELEEILGGVIPMRLNTNTYSPRKEQIRGSPKAPPPKRSKRNTRGGKRTRRNSR